MTDVTTKYERDPRTGALISRDYTALQKRKNEIETRRRLGTLEEKVSSMEDKLDRILNYLSAADKR